MWARSRPPAQRSRARSPRRSIPRGADLFWNSVLVRERLTLIEYEPAFVKLLAERFPSVRVVNGDGFEFERSIGNHAAEDLAAIVSGMPLLNFPHPKRRALIETALRRLKRGAPFVQFSYGFQPPLPAPAGASVRMAASFRITNGMAAR